MWYLTPVGVEMPHFLFVIMECVKTGNPLLEEKQLAMRIVQINKLSRRTSFCKLKDPIESRKTVKT